MLSLDHPASALRHPSITRSHSTTSKGSQGGSPSRLLRGIRWDTPLVPRQYPAAWASPFILYTYSTNEYFLHPVQLHHQYDRTRVVNIELASLKGTIGVRYKKSPRENRARPKKEGRERGGSTTHHSSRGEQKESTVTSNPQVHNTLFDHSTTLRHSLPAPLYLPRCLPSVIPRKKRPSSPSLPSRLFVPRKTKTARAHLHTLLRF